MFVKNFTVLFMFTFFIFCEPKFVDNLPKCHLNDDDCLRNLYQTVLHDIGQTGIPEVNIPPVDPIIVTNVSVNAMDVLNITVTEGVVEGIKDCIFQKFSINIKEEHAFQENTCDLTLKGHYIIESESPVFKSLFGDSSINGEGNGIIKIEKLHLKFDFPFYFQKRSDGEIYIKGLYNLVNYDYTIDGPISFDADDLHLGDQEMSKTILNTLNENSQLIVAAFGKPFVDKALKDYYFKYSGNFFDVIPTKHFIIDDLSPYAKP